MIGISTKNYFKTKYLNNKEKYDITFDDINCRQNFDITMINKLNTYDYIIIGGGGLILPDTNPNKISCWQLEIDKNLYKKIKVPIYVISIGFNLFFNQNINMSKRNSYIEDKSRQDIFKNNIIELIKCSKHFSMRHKNDIEELIKIVGEEYREKIIFELCPTIWYSNIYWKKYMEKIPNNNKFIAIEIKDDREENRYYKIGKAKFYDELLKFVLFALGKNKKIAILSHDGSSNFYNYLIDNKINLPLLQNNIANEKKIYDNYAKIKTIICTAGHSQMISYGLGIKIISLVTHPKIKNFCLDICNNDFIEVNNNFNINNFLENII
jgi:polysaccharide pyruvyl transferase WcaK-like protein